MGRSLVLHVPLFSPVARSPALLDSTCSPWKRAAKDPSALRQKRRFRAKPNFFPRFPRFPMFPQFYRSDIPTLFNGERDKIRWKPKCQVCLCLYTDTQRPDFVSGVRRTLTNRPKLTNFLFDSDGFVIFLKAESSVRLCSLILREANFCSIRVR